MGVRVLQKHNDLFKSIFVDNIQPMIMIDAAGIVIEYNQAAEQLFQYSSAEIIGKNIKKIMPSDMAKKHDGYLKRYQKTRIPHVLGTPREVEAQKKDGSKVYILICVTELCVDKEVFYTAVINDISDARKIREQNKKLIDFNVAIINDVEMIGNYNALIQNILKHFSTLFDFEIGHFYQYSRSKNYLKSSHLFFYDRPRKYKAFIDITKKTVFEKGVGLPGLAWEKGGIILYSDIQNMSDFVRTKLSEKPLNLAGALALPIFYNHKILGVVEFYSTRVLSLTNVDVEIFEKLSSIISGLYGKHQEGRIQNLVLDNCGEGVLVLNPEGCMTFANPQACKILGYTLKELIGNVMHEKIHPLQNGRNIYQCVDQKKSLFIDDEVFWSKGGQAVPVEYTATPMRENKNFVGVVVSFWDVSEKRKIKKQMAFISDVQNAYIQAEDKTVIFETILQHIVEMTESESGFIATVKKDLKNKPYFQTYAIVDHDQHTSVELAFERLKFLFDRVLKTDKMVISNTPSHHKSLKLKNYLGIPLFGLDGDLIAMYGIVNREGGYSKHLVNDLKPLTSVVSNMIESYQSYQIIEDMARLDSLTKLFNRQFAYMKLNERIKEHRQGKTRFCILMLDLNHFKFINDMYGVHMGDRLLVEFAQRISNLLKKIDFFARIGGDEFLIILDKKSKLTEITSCLSKASDKPYLLDKQSIKCGFSMGVACYPSGGQTKEELLNHVAFALYDAKRKKENICFFSKKEKKFFEEIRMLESDLEQAFLKKEFYMLYQPQVDLRTGEILGLEALIRWNHPKKGLLCPDFFIPYLEQWGLSERLNEYVLEKVLSDVGMINLYKPLTISINISPRILDYKQHFEQLVKIAWSKQLMLKANHIKLEFEITESSFISHEASILNASLSHVKKHGIRCAMDDFGMEYSSINRLTEHKFDTVKIDKIFTHKLDKRNKKPAVAIIEALIHLSKSLDFKLVAEGPETEAQVQKLLEVGCLYGQGFYFHKPIPLIEVKRLIKKQTST